MRSGTSRSPCCPRACAACTRPLAGCTRTGSGTSCSRAPGTRWGTRQTCGGRVLALGNRLLVLFYIFLPYRSRYVMQNVLLQSTPSFRRKIHREKRNFIETSVEGGLLGSGAAYSSPTQMPRWQRSSFVQATPSSQLVPSDFSLYTQMPDLRGGGSKCCPSAQVPQETITTEIVKEQFNLAAG